MTSVGTCPRGGRQTQRKSRVGHHPACIPAGMVQGEAEHRHLPPHTPPQFHACGPARQHQAQPRGRHSTTTSESRLPSAPRGWDPARPVECVQMLLTPSFSAGEDCPPHGPKSPLSVPSLLEPPAPSPLSFPRKAAPGLHPPTSRHVPLTVRPRTTPFPLASQQGQRSHPTHGWGDTRQSCPFSSALETPPPLGHKRLILSPS